MQGDAIQAGLPKFGASREVRSIAGRVTEKLCDASDREILVPESCSVSRNLVRGVSDSPMAGFAAPLLLLRESGQTAAAYFMQSPSGDYDSIEATPFLRAFTAKR